jgi:hypothetical protein
MLYHTNLEIADSSNIEYGFYLGLCVHFHVKAMFSVKLGQAANLCIIGWAKSKFKLTFVAVGWYTW